ncbi:D-aminoacyl-tRNA deacylase [Maridesulfovibrio bastinii]|uniref:D-aminoacyl-tRNA deacylase n=1 Tax=Maridesulfovibrio bastinii TaxID=47157 RepID=UPI0004116538|nr:D-aminoacyl-tRNA deacylase [Maridesulfovibrio bastinii]
MRLVIQRVTDATVSVNGETVSETGKGHLVLIGFGKDDTIEFAGSKAWKTLIGKLTGLRIFEDDQGRFNLSLEDIAGDLMLVSQFTLYASCRKGRRPSFSAAAPPAIAEKLYDLFVEDVKKQAPGKVGCGIFGASMKLDFTNDGPVTIILDSEDFS